MMKLKAVFILLAIVLTLAGIFSYLQPKKYHSVVPLLLDSGKVPLIAVEIEGASYLLNLDLALPIPLTLQPAILAKITKRKHSVSGWKFGKGECQVCPSYIIPSMKIGNMKFSGLQTLSREPLENTLWVDDDDQPSPAVGSLGRFILRKFNVLLNFPAKKLCISNDFAKLKEEGFSLAEATKVPLEEGRKLALIVQTDLGIKRLLIETTATINGLACSQDSASGTEHGYKIISTKTFLIGDCDLGPVTFYIQPSEGADGWIGMDFLENHVIYIDYGNKLAYIKKS